MGEDMAPYASMEHRRGFLGFGRHHEDAKVTEAPKQAAGSSGEQSAVQDGAAVAAMTGEAQTTAPTLDVVETPDGSMPIDLKNQSAKPGEGAHDESSAPTAATDDLATKVEIGQTVEPTSLPPDTEVPSGTDVQDQLDKLNESPADVTIDEAVKPVTPKEDPWVAGLKKEAASEAAEIDESITKSNAADADRLDEQPKASDLPTNPMDDAAPKIITSTEIPVQKPDEAGDVAISVTDKHDSTGGSTAETIAQPKHEQTAETPFPEMKIDSVNTANSELVEPSATGPAAPTVESPTAETAPELPKSPIDGMEQKVQMEDANPGSIDAGESAEKTDDNDKKRPDLSEVKGTISDLAARIQKLQDQIDNLDKAA